MTPWGTTEAAALAYAATLDHAFAGTPTEALEEALMAVGDLLGGLSVHGFAADLAAHLERGTEDLLSDADACPRDYRLAREDDAGSWLYPAQEIMAGLQVAEAA